MTLAAILPDVGRVKGRLTVLRGALLWCCSNPERRGSNAVLIRCPFFPTNSLQRMSADKRMLAPRSRAHPFIRCSAGYSRPFSVISQMLRGGCCKCASMISSRINRPSRRRLRTVCAVLRPHGRRAIGDQPRRPRAEFERPLREAPSPGAGPSWPRIGGRAEEPGRVR